MSIPHISSSAPREIRDFALSVVASVSLDEKLTFPTAELTDETPGEPYRAPAPGRPPELTIRGARCRIDT